jgi:C4-type Zn-finger protein
MMQDRSNEENRIIHCPACHSANKKITKIYLADSYVTMTSQLVVTYECRRCGHRFCETREHAANTRSL